jgi:hypothetical protein
MGQTGEEIHASDPFYISDRRAWPRRRSDIGQITMWTSATEYQVVEVRDESLTGLAVLVGDVSKIALNRDVRLAFPDRQFWAVVRHIQQLADGIHRVGLEWGCSDRRFLSGSQPFDQSGSTESDRQRN